MSGLLRPHHARHRTKFQTVPATIHNRIGACLVKMKGDGTVEAVDTGNLYRGYRLAGG
jgi:hypothetical protein